MEEEIREPEVVEQISAEVDMWAPEPEVNEKAEDEGQQSTD